MNLCCLPEKHAHLNHWDQERKSLAAASDGLDDDVLVPAEDLET